MRKNRFVMYTLLTFCIYPLTLRASPSRKVRSEHAKELLGSRHNKSIVNRFSRKKTADQFIGKWVRIALPKKFRARSYSVARAIIQEAKRQAMDPLFLMAVIESESAFNPLAKGTSGELGLMQMLPDTAKEVCKIRGIRWRGNKTLQDPIRNIKLGAAYLAFLRDEHERHGRLYLSAYNMGSGNLQKAINRKVLPKDYARRVMKRYLALYSAFRQFDRLKVKSLSQIEEIRMASFRAPAQFTTPKKVLLFTAERDQVMTTLSWIGDSSEVVEDLPWKDIIEVVPDETEDGAMDESPPIDLPESNL